MDPDTFFNRIRSFLIDLLKKESRTGAVRSQTTTWIRFRKDRELVELAFNSRMTNVYNLSDMDETVNEMITHIKGQIENLALLNSRFVFDEVLFTNVDFHQLTLMRGSSYLPLPNWLARKKAIINPKNNQKGNQKLGTNDRSDHRMFKNIRHWCHCNPLSVTSIICWKVDGALQRPKGMTLNPYKPPWVIKAVNG